MGRDRRIRLGPKEFASCSLGEPIEPHPVEHLVSGAQLLAGVDPPPLGSQPFAVDQMRAGELHSHAATAEPVDRLAVEPVREVALAEQSADARGDPDCRSRNHPVNLGDIE